MDEGWLPVGIAEALERGATVVTVNQRAARSLRRSFDRRSRAQGLGSWRPAAVVAWDAWVAGLWAGLLMEGQVSQMLLNRTQEHAVWRGILGADAELGSLRTHDSLAEMAAQAWRLVCAYNGLGRLRGAAMSADTRAFQRWAVAFERRCRVDGLLSQTQLEGTLTAAVEAGQVRVGAVALVGFDGMTPAQMGLVEALRGAGVAVEELTVETAAEQRMVVAGGDEREELLAAARWVRGVVEGSPGARVAVIVPGLEGQRAEIDRVFREVLAPELESIEAAGEGGPYEFSVGVRLAGMPMVAVALDLLRWAMEALPVERVSALLLSPYFAVESEERGARAEFDAFELRRARRLRPEVSLEGMVFAVEGSRGRLKMTRLMRRLRGMQAAASLFRANERLTHAEWVERMGELLEAAGWGAGAGEDSVEFQTRRKWEGVLDELATLDFDGGRVGFERALEEVERIARETMFAPESREAPVQVMGPLEAAGGSFDAVWFLRAGDLSWPVVAAGSPLLPWHLQRELGVPGTDVARDGEHARRVTRRIAQCAGTVVFSYAVESDEGRQRVSPALDGLGLEEMEAQKLGRTEAARQVVELEVIEDSERVQALPDTVVRGGARILELQAACGFRAFAEWRLWATELETAELGIDARESGTVVHKVLEFFWDAVETQGALKAMSDEEREGVLEHCIELALKKTADVSVTGWDTAYLAVQRERLARLMRPWLELEMGRPPFEVKLSEKEFNDVSVGPLRLDVRVDRVDVTEAGELILDYKTGLATPNDWLTERPDAPQLPLYAVLADAERLKGVAFGVVRAGESMELKGYASEDGVLAKAAKMTMPLEAQVEDWRRVLVGLATEFHEGTARVRPKRYPTTCERCGQRILCRLDASLLEEDDEDGDGAAAEVDRG